MEKSRAKCPRKHFEPSLSHGVHVRQLRHCFRQGPLRILMIRRPYHNPVILPCDWS